MSPKFHLDILNNERRNIFCLLGQFSKYGYLAGGTALAVQLGHRYSYDFDIFCEKEISHSIILKCRKVFSIQQILVNTEEEFSFLTQKKIKITFLYYPFTFFGKLITIDGKIPILNILDIATSKAYTLNRRGNYRDYVDLYFIIQEGKISLEKIIKNAQKVYGELFAPKLFLGQLLYTKDLSSSDIKSVKFVAPSISFITITTFFQKEVKKIQKTIIFV